MLIPKDCTSEPVGCRAALRVGASLQRIWRSGGKYNEGSDGKKGSEAEKTYLAVEWAFGDRRIRRVICY